MSVDVGGLALSLSEAGNEGSGGGWIGGDVPEALGSEYVHPCFTIACEYPLTILRYAELLSKMYNDTQKAIQTGEASYACSQLFEYPESF